MSQATGEFTYDDLPYVGNAYVQTHPERLASLGRLFGMTPAPVERCRVLEIACGDGNNLLAMAYALPDSSFLGIDLAAKPLAVGQARAAALGLKNIRLEVADLMEFPASEGPFDYIIAHGIYSWCPAPVRDRLLAVCGAHLAPQGVAFVSFNAYPGYHIGDLNRQLMRFHLTHAGAKTPTDQAKQALSILDFVARAQPENSAYHLTLKQARDFYTERISQGGDAGLAWFHHDLLSTNNDAVYFHQFVAHTGQHGLQFVTEVQPRVLRMIDLPADTIKTLSALQGDPLALEQYLDFILCIPFRQVLLCRQGIALDRAPGAAAMRDLSVAGDLSPERAEPDPAAAPDAPENFSRPTGKITVTNPDAKATMRRIHDRWPESVSFRELAANLSAEIGEHDLADLMLRLCVGAFISFRTRIGVASLVPGDRPVGSAFARLQAESGLLVANLYHQMVSLEPRTRFVLRKLDGSLGREELVAMLGEWVTSGQAAKEFAGLNGAEVTDIPALDGLDAALDETLRKLAYLGLLLP